MKNSRGGWLVFPAVLVLLMLCVTVFKFFSVMGSSTPDSFTSGYESQQQTHMEIVVNSNPSCLINCSSNIDLGASSANLSNNVPSANQDPFFGYMGTGANVPLTTAGNPENSTVGAYAGQPTVTNGPTGSQFGFMDALPLLVGIILLMVFVNWFKGLFGKPA